MKILLDECLPRRLLRDLNGYSVTTAPRQGWSGKKDAELILLADGEFDVFITIDSNIVFQQNLRTLHLRMIVLRAVNSRYETLQPLVPDLLQALNRSMASGSIVTVG
jgi:predicted nuclease of predicted toxin-antitoxin system